ncbi:hypothetical protein ACFFSP_15585, partial [Persicitalea jodogahamensis]
MKELSDKELDELFRKSAEEFEPRYEASDWHSLRRRLDEADGVVGGWWFRKATPWLAGLLLLMIGGLGGYYYYAGDNSAVDRAENKAASSSTILPSNQKHPKAKAKSPANQSESETLRRATIDIDNDEPGLEGSDHSVANQPAGDQGGMSGQSTQNQGKQSDEQIKVKELPRNPASASGVRKQTTPNRGRGDGAILLSQKTDIPDISNEMNIGRSELSLGASQQVPDYDQLRQPLPAVEPLSFQTR